MTKTLNQLTEITALADDDLLLARDVSAVEDFKITLANLKETSGINQRTIYVGSVVEDLNGLSAVDGQSVIVREYRPDTGKGAGKFWYDASVAKSSHDGASIISPTVPKASTQAGASDAIKEEAFRDGTGETDAGGTGCFVAEPSEMLSPYRWGVIAGSGNDDAYSWRALLDWYAGRTVAITPAFGTPAFTVDKIEPVRGVSDVSFRVTLPSYIEADFSRVILRRHPDWSEAPGVYLLDSTDLYRAELGGLSFYDEDFAFNAENQNPAVGHIRISGVQFVNCNNAMRVDCQSSSTTCENWIFDQCQRALIVAKGDHVLFKDGWMTQKPLTANQDCTVLVNDGFLKFQDVIANPATHTGSEVAWVNNHSRVEFDNFRFGGEAGSCAAVNNYAEADVASPFLDPTMVKIHNCQAYGVDRQGGTQVATIVRLFKLPNQISFCNNRGMIDTDEVISWGSTADQAGQLALVNGANRGIDYVFTGNQRHAFQDFPPNLVQVFAPYDMPMNAVASGTSGETVSDLRVTPFESAQFSLSFSGQTQPGANPNYRSTWNGLVDVYTGNNGSTVVKRIAATKLSGGNGGGTFASAFTVTAVFWDGSTESSEVPAGDTDNTVRIKITGWGSTFEGAGFVGRLRALN